MKKSLRQVYIPLSIFANTKKKQITGTFNRKIEKRKEMLSYFQLLYVFKGITQRNICMFKGTLMQI